MLLLFKSGRWVGLFYSFYSQLERLTGNPVEVNNQCLVERQQLILESRVVVKSSSFIIIPRIDGVVAANSSFRWARQSITHIRTPGNGN